MIPYFFYGSGMYWKHPNHTYGRNRNNSANNRAYMERNKNIFWFVNNSEYHHQEMGLIPPNSGWWGMAPLPGPSASSLPKLKMISEYKRILWQATSSLIIDLSSLASFFTLAFLIGILFATQMPSCNVYRLDLTKTKDSLFFQILAANGLLLRFVTRNHLLETLPEDVQMAKFSPIQFLLQ